MNDIQAPVGERLSVEDCTRGDTLGHGSAVLLLHGMHDSGPRACCLRSAGGAYRFPTPRFWPFRLPSGFRHGVLFGFIIRMGARSLMKGDPFQLFSHATR